MGPSQWEPDERIPYSGTRRFIKAFQEKFDRIPSYHTASAYASLRLLQNAVEECKCLDQARIREYLLALDSLTLLGRFKVDLQGRQVGHTPSIVQWQQGRKEIIYPPKFRTAQPQMPTPSVPEH
jgi:branched-chain amino acid transport system substrate-binding protein